MHVILDGLALRSEWAGQCKMHISGGKGKHWGIYWSRLNPGECHNRPSPKPSPSHNPLSPHASHTTSLIIPVPLCQVLHRPQLRSAPHNPLFPTQSPDFQPTPALTISSCCLPETNLAVVTPCDVVLSSVPADGVSCNLPKSLFFSLSSERWTPASAETNLTLILHSVLE